MVRQINASQNFVFSPSLHPFLHISGLIARCLVFESVPRPDLGRLGFETHWPVLWNGSPVVYFRVYKIEIITHRSC